MKRKIKMLLDSGAFTAWRLRREVTVEGYADFLGENADHVAHAVNLDVIPGTPGSRPSSAQVEEAAEASWANYRFLRWRGFHTWPVYHIGERRYWLEKMVGEGAGYIGLGGIALLDDSERVRWLDEVFSYLCGATGYPCVKVHGLGVSTPEVIHRYPWASTDSTSWVSCSSMGGVCIPTRGDYRVKPLIVYFTADKMDGGHSPALLEKGHYHNLGPTLQRYVRDYLADNGYAPDGLNHYKDRRRLNVRFYERCAKAHTLTPFRRRGGGLFAETAHDLPGVRPEAFRFYFATQRRWCLAWPLAVEKARYHLMSYYEVKNCPDFKAYVETGEFPLIVSKTRLKEKLRVRH